MVIKEDDFSISIAMRDAESTDVNKLKNELENTYVKNTIKRKNSVIYKDIMEDIDITYTVVDNKIKENIILKKSTEKNEFYFDIKTEGLSAVSENGSIIFLDANSEVRFTIEDLYMVDAKGVVNNNVFCELQVDDNEYIIKLIVDKDFLNDKSTAWPVVIDSTITIPIPMDTTICSASPYSNRDNSSEPRLGTGYHSTYGKMRTFLRFGDIRYVIPSNAEIRSAYIGLRYAQSGNSPMITAYRIKEPWSASNIRWGKDGYPVAYDKEITANAFYYSSGWYAMGVVSWVRKFHSGEVQNYGFMIKSENESSGTNAAAWHSAESPEVDKRPVLQVTYYAPGDGIYMIRNMSTNKYLTADNKGFITQHSRNSKDGKQLWYIEHITENRCRISSVGYLGSDRKSQYYLDVKFDENGKITLSTSPQYRTWILDYNTQSGICKIRNASKSNYYMRVSSSDSRPYMSTISSNNTWGLEKVILGNYHKGGYTYITDDVKKIRIELASSVTTHPSFGSSGPYNLDIFKSVTKWNNISSNIKIYDHEYLGLPAPYFSVKIEHRLGAGEGIFWPIHQGTLAAHDGVWDYAYIYMDFYHLRSKNYISEDIEGFILHELGHALKLRHPDGYEHSSIGADYPTNESVVSVMNHMNAPDSLRANTVMPHDKYNLIAKWGR